jgi:hypothetical protein
VPFAPASAHALPLLLRPPRRAVRLGSAAPAHDAAGALRAAHAVDLSLLARFDRVRHRPILLAGRNRAQTRRPHPAAVPPALAGHRSGPAPLATAGPGGASAYRPLFDDRADGRATAQVTGRGPDVDRALVVGAATGGRCAAASVRGTPRALLLHARAGPGREQAVPAACGGPRGDRAAALRPAWIIPTAVGVDLAEASPLACRGGDRRRVRGWSGLSRDRHLRRRGDRSA